jgi:hypothetical protein
MQILKYVVLIIAFTTQCFAANEKPTNYILTIDGVTVELALDQAAKIKLKSGAEVPILLSKREYGKLVSGALSFQYPGQYTVASTKVDDEITQHIIVTALGTMMLVQEYQGGVPAGLLDIMYDKMVEEPKAMGVAIERTELSRSIAKGQILKGVRAHYKGNDDDVTIDVVITDVGKTGFMIMTLNDTYTAPQEAPMIEQFWQQIELDPSPAP